jgi:hypothetical protein
MLAELNITKARQNLSSLYDQVYNTYEPKIIKRKQTEEILLLRVDLQKMLLSNFKLKPEVINEDDGSVTLALDQLDIYVNSISLEDAISELIDDLKHYAQDFMKRSQLFLNAPNRKSHFPYILRILLCDSDEELRGLLEI